MKMKKLGLLALTGMMAFGLAACSSDDSTTTTEDALVGWDYVEANGQLIVGLDDTFAPMGFRDTDGELVGFDIDLAEAVGEYLGIEVVFQPISWDAKDMELESKRIDVIWNGMSATAERAETYSLTKKYLNNQIVVMGLTDSEITVTEVADLAGLTVGTQADSAALETMMAADGYDLFADGIAEYATYDEAILDMQAGRVDVIVVDQVLGEYKNAQMGEVMTTYDFNFGDDYYAIGCRKDSADLAEVLNEALAALIADGTAAAISEEWFGKDIVILED